MKKTFLIIISFLSLFTLSSCGRQMELAVPGKVPAKLNENINALSINPGDFSNFATTFTMFFIPEESDLTWETNLYNKSDKYSEKVAKIMSNIIRRSDEFDLYDQKILDLNKVKAPLTTKYEELECDFDYTDECSKIDEQLKQITADAAVDLKLPNGTVKKVDYEGYKSWLIEEIQSSVDDYNRINPDMNKPKNWMLYGDAPVYEINQLDNKTFKITFPNLGPFGEQNHYSTETGDIYDVSLAPSEWSDKIELLKFKIKEKGVGAKYTGFVWEVTLERSFVVGKLRYKGDVLKVDSSGKVLRRGICKVDFARKGS